MRCQQKSYVVGETVVVGQRSNTRIFTSGGVVSADGPWQGVSRCGRG
jgi:hypothetical protein